MADGFRVTASVSIGGRTYSNEAMVTTAQMADLPTRAKIRRYMQWQLIQGIIEEMGGISFTAVRELDVSTFTPDATGEARAAEVSPPQA